MTTGCADADGANPTTPPRVLVVQPGARRHYAVPATLHAAGMLERMDTEWFVRPATLSGKITELAGKLGPAALRKLAGRRHPGLNDANVGMSLTQTRKHMQMQRRFPSRAEGLKWYLPHAGRNTLRRGFGNATTLYGFIRNIDPALCRAAQQRGLSVVGDQIIAPSSVEARELRAQLERFPGWEPRLSADNIEQYRTLDHETWASCDAITCMSDWVRDGLIAEGQPADKLWLLPYPSDHTKLHAIERPTDRPTLTVGFVGAVGLRKGAGYFFEVAKRLASEHLRFVMVGPVKLDAAVVADQRGAVEVVGPVPRPEVAGWLERFDLFYFPSTCEGSAGSVNEAMAAALPVVTTPNSGSTARDGIEGFLIDYADVDAACERITRLAQDAKLRQTLGSAGRARTREFDLSWYQRELTRRIAELNGCIPAATAS